MKINESDGHRHRIILSVIISLSVLKCEASSEFWLGILGLCIGAFDLIQSQAILIVLQTTLDYLVVISRPLHRKVWSCWDWPQTLLKNLFLVSDIKFYLTENVFHIVLYVPSYMVLCVCHCVIIVLFMLNADIIILLHLHRSCQNGNSR